MTDDINNFIRGARHRHRPQAPSRVEPEPQVGGFDGGVRGGPPPPTPSMDRHLRALWRNKRRGRSNTVNDGTVIAREATPLEAVDFAPEDASPRRGESPWPP